MAIVMSNGDRAFQADDVATAPAITVSPRRRLQIIALGQGVVFAAAVFAMGSFALAGIREATTHSGGTVLSPAVPMTVGQGETMWSLAKRYGDPRMSQLDRLDVLARANGLAPSANLHPGQRLLVPVENPCEAAHLQPVMASR